jgi:pSer/pThr/pTyr-binding forkhead associated (FHA) protein
MNAILFLVLRLVAASLLLLFWGWGFYTIWKDLRDMGRKQENSQIPGIRFESQTSQTPQHIYFATPLVTVGRARTSDFRIENDTVSHAHARLNYHTDQWWLEDLSSTNGTSVNEQHIESAIAVRGDDIVGYGETRFRIQIEAPKR